MSRDKQNIKTTDWLIRGMTEEEITKAKEEAIKEAEAEIRDKQTEIHELAKQMSEAISTEVEQKYIMEEAKLEAVLRTNGWVKAEEIFAEIEPLLDGSNYSAIEIIWNVKYLIAELKKKYTESSNEIMEGAKNDTRRSKGTSRRRIR